MIVSNYSDRLQEIRRKLYQKLDDKTENDLIREKKEILNKIKEHIQNNICSENKQNKQVPLEIKLLTRKDIVEYHDDLVRKIDIIFETELSSLNTTEYKEEIEDLNKERMLILDEIQKCRDENLSDENIGKRLKFCFIYEKINDYYIANLFIANYDHDFVTFEPKFREKYLDDFEEVNKSCLLNCLAEENLIIDFTNSTKYELNGLRIKRGTFENFSQVNFDFMNEYINKDMIQGVSFEMYGFYLIPKKVFKSLRTIKRLFINDYYGLIDSNDFDILENLVSARFLRGLQEIRPNSFNGLINLTYLNLSSCCLSYLDDGCFDGLVNLKYLNLQSNDIRQIGDNVFAPLKQLICLNLRENMIKNKVNLKGLENLRYLNINSSFLFHLKNVSSTLEALTFDQLTKSEDINTQALKYLNISKLPEDVYDNPEAFKDLQYLEANRFCSDHQFLNQFNLQNLKVLICKFENIPKFGQNLCNLKYLEIEDVREFDTNCFEYLKQLEYLAITIYGKASLVEKIEDDHFKGINDLKYFCLKIKFEAFRDLSEKENIFESLFKSSVNLSYYKNSSFYQISVSDFDGNPLNYLEISEEISETLDDLFWQNLE
ncbi:unnamed protein product [Brachionus calyciflorus]|uniref:Uncharacterized protein n=1 Tax=Brachionus calyciflorus TaxID=104777 RepID=A0A814MM92_9BILA|nr:unnamed protein product [Brachionus calyciflorus]